MPEYILPGKNDPRFSSLDAFTQGYIEAALWTSEEQLSEESGRQMSGTGFYRDNNAELQTVLIPGDIGFSDLAPETVQTMKTECARFHLAACDYLDAANKLDSSYTEARAGHDFWLTRNGHGAGFWDRGLGEIGDKLTKIAKCRRETNLYIGDDGKIYQA